MLVYNLGTKFWLKLDPSFSDIWSSTLFAYDGWACSIEMDTFNGEVLSLMSNVELVILPLPLVLHKISFDELC